MHVRRFTAVTAAAFMLAMIMPMPSASACDKIADHSVWSDNCLTYWLSYRVSDLTTGVQVILKYDDHQGWVSATDGYYGNIDGTGLTPAAVKDYQTDMGLDDDGKTGANTWGTMDNSFVYDYDAITEWYYNIDNSTWRMKIVKSTSQAYVRKANGAWVRVDAWRS